ncbi:MAG: tetratricopeptide repeat protein [Bryobacteraceae bacterium]|nr:tetratricopeptide repeat protein [Bryobacteraceae bacterium]
MRAAYRKLTWLPAATLLLAGAAMAQTGAIEGDVKGPDGAGLRGALVKIERTDIKGNYKVKTDKKGHYFHAGLPLGQYNVVLEVEGKDVDRVQGVRTRLGDPVPVNFDLKAQAQKQQAMTQAAETGQLTQEQTREMSKEQREAIEKAMKERQQAMAKNKALNDAFNGGMEALKTKQYDAAVQSFTKASELDPKQHVVWAQLAESYIGVAGSKTGQEQTDAFTKGIEAYGKAMELKPDDADYYNNRGLALAKAKKFEEAQADLEKAAQLNPPNAGRYFYNLGAILVNTGNIEPAGIAFKKAIEADPNYADAQYQYGVYLLSKAQTTADGKVTPPPGTREAFQKYIDLKPDGPFAESAKGMLATLEGSVQTTYENPDAKKNQPKKGKKK